MVETAPESVIDKRDPEKEMAGTIEGLLESYLDDPDEAEKYLRGLEEESFKQLYTDLVRVVTDEEAGSDRKINLESLKALFVKIENNPEPEEE